MRTNRPPHNHQDGGSRQLWHERHKFNLPPGFSITHYSEVDERHGRYWIYLAADPDGKYVWITGDGDDPVRVWAGFTGTLASGKLYDNVQQAIDILTGVYKLMPEEMDRW